MKLTEQELEALIAKAAATMQWPVITKLPKSDGLAWWRVMLCGMLVDSFDTYYYSAEISARDLAAELKVRIKDCQLPEEPSQEAKLLSIQCKMFAVCARIEAYKAGGYNEQSFYTLEDDLKTLAEEALSVTKAL